MNSITGLKIQTLRNLDPSELEQDGWRTGDVVPALVLEDGTVVYPAVGDQGEALLIGYQGDTPFNIVGKETKGKK